MSGWGDLFKDKYEMVKDESTGEMIMVDKSAPKYQLDASGNRIWLCQKRIKKFPRASSRAFLVMGDLTPNLANAG